MESSNIGSPRGLARNQVRRFIDLTERALDVLASLLVQPASMRPPSTVITCPVV